MSREIKFRGLRTKPEYHENKWKIGNLLNDCSIGEVGYGLDSYTYAEVIPETVGQFTGIKDKTGIDIYEGDICKDHMNDEIKEVDYEYGSWSWEYYESPDLFWEVIGNIHENKELI